MSDEDKALAEQYLKRWGAKSKITMHTGLDALVDTFASALATVRRETRERAFKDATKAVHEILVGNRGAFHLFNDVEAALERAATNSQNGENDA